MKRKLFLIFVMAMLMIGLSGCGDKGAKMRGFSDAAEDYSNLPDGKNRKETVATESVDDSDVDLTDYSSYLKKIWIEKEWISNDYDFGRVSLVITKIENGHIEGYVQNLGCISDDYFNFSVGKDSLYPFVGEICDGIAECEYVDGRKKPLMITFYENDCIRVKMDGDEYRNYLLRPYHVSDRQFCGEPTTYEVELDSWGTVTVFYANLEDRHSYPWVLLLDDRGNILYKFPGRFRIDSEVSEIVIEDVNGDGLEDVKVITCMGGSDEERTEWFFYQTESGLFYLGMCIGNNAADIPPFLTFDWTAQEVLFHSISPEDSARGWVFSLADVDFDGKLEVLITLTANHCGGNSLYIYKQDAGKVFSLADTYATFREDVTWLSQGYGRLSSYLDIALLDAYVNEEGEYRYLSLDYTQFGGFGELFLYVTTLQEDIRPVKLAEIQFYENESFDEMEIYFQEERVYEPEELHELIEQYMAGYTKVEMEYETLEVSFERDIVGWNENGKRQCLEDLYGALEEFLKYESDRSEQYAEEGYELTIYNSLGTTILSETYPKEPGISWVAENVMEIAISAGSPARYVYYVDTKEGKVSDIYFNPILVGEEYVAYMEDAGELILSDIFYTDQQEDLLYMTIVRDFTETANPMSAIVGIELIDGENVELTYLTGNDYIVVTEIIPIGTDMGPKQSAASEGAYELIVNNPYFYDRGEVFLQAKAKYFAGHFNGGFIETVAYIDVDMIQAYEDGCVYKFTVDIDENDIYFEEGWLNQYFYVTEDKIYEVPSRINIPSEGLVFNFDDDINLLTEMFDNDERLVEWSTIVCQEDEMIEDRESYYQSVTKRGSQITYYAYSLKANGDVWWTTYYTWEEERGLISCGFRKGPGEGYDLTLYDIEELTVAG